MSDIKIQESPAVTPGAQEPLADERRGNENLQQNNLSFCRGSEVSASSQNSERTFRNGPKFGSEVNGVSPINRDPGLNSGLSVSGRENEQAKPVDFRSVEGSYAGDHRQRGKDAVLPANPAPREGMGQARLTNKLDNPPAQSFTGNQND